MGSHAHMCKPSFLGKRDEDVGGGVNLLMNMPDKIADNTTSL